MLYLNANHNKDLPLSVNKRKYETVSSIRCILACGYSQIEASTHLHSLINISFPSEEKLDPWPHNEANNRL